MFLNTMFVNWLGFCSKQTLYKSTIYSCYQDYMKCYYNVDPKYRDWTRRTAKDWEEMTIPQQNSLRENSRKQEELVEEMVTLVKAYCKKYPDEKICHFCNFKSYDEYPYRLKQTVPEFIKLL